MSAGTWPTRQTGTVTPPTGGAAACAYDAPGRITTKTTGASIDTHSYLNTLSEATERFEAAERAARSAEIHANSLVPGVPLRYGVEATRRLRAADAELEAARVAYDAAQDLPAPED